MDPQRQQKARVPSGTFNLITAGLAQSKRKHLAARFPEGTTLPAFAQEQYVLTFEQQPGKQQKDEQRESSLLLGRKSAKKGGPSTKQLQGVPRADAGGNYFMLSKAPTLRDFILQPLDATFTFKQLARSPALSIDEVEAQMRAAAGGGADPARLLPKSMRRQMQESAAAAAAEKQLQEEVAPLFDKNKVAELSVKYGGPTTQGKLVLGHSDDDEGSDEGWGLTGAEGEEEGGGNARKKGPGKDKKGAKGAAKGRKGGKDGGGGDIPEDEMPEDIFAGEEDELRPAAPVEDADWEYNEDAADDDLDQGASDEEGMADDPGYRKQLGLEADEDEEEKKDEPAEGEEGGDKKEGEPGAGAAGGAAPSQASVGGSVESESVMDEDELGGEVVDAEDLDRLAEEREHSTGQPAKRRKGSVGPAGRDRSPAPSRLATPPLGTAAAAGSSRATPPLGGGRRGSTPPLGKAAAAGAGRQAAAAGGSRKTPPPSAAAAAARRTPPPANAAAAAVAAGAAKRKREEAAAGSAAAGAAFAAGAAAAAAGGSGGGARGYIWRPEQLDGQGVPTVESVAQALREMGPITVSQLSLLQEHLDVGRIGDEGKKLLKQRMLQVAKVEPRGGVKYVVLKHAS